LRGSFKKYAFAFVAVSALLVAAGCGDDDDDDNGTTTPDDSTSTGTSSPGTTETSTSEPSGDIGDVDVMAVWSGEEEQNFRAMVAPWESETGGSLTYTGTRDLTQQITIRVSGGNPPDVIIAPEIGVMQSLVEDGDVVPLSQCEGLEDYVRDNYSDAFLELGSVDGELYGLIMKVDNKGTIFYSPSQFEENGWEPLTEESTFDDLVASRRRLRRRARLRSPSASKAPRRRAGSSPTGLRRSCWPPKVSTRTTRW
jgi:alpha-glucoside transport system substrate-binding protein